MHTFAKYLGNCHSFAASAELELNKFKRNAHGRESAIIYQCVWCVWV